MVHTDGELPLCSALILHFSILTLIEDKHPGTGGWVEGDGVKLGGIVQRPPSGLHQAVVVHLFLIIIVLVNEVTWNRLIQLVDDWIDFPFPIFFRILPILNCIIKFLDSGFNSAEKVFWNL